jgi:hypothetical protein
MVEINLSGKYQTSKFHTKCNIDFYKQINIKQIKPKDNLIGISQQSLRNSIFHLLAIDPNNCGKMSNTTK